MRKLFNLVRSFFYFLGQLLRGKKRVDPRTLSDRAFITYIKSYRFDTLPSYTKRILGYELHQEIHQRHLYKRSLIEAQNA